MWEAIRSNRRRSLLLFCLTAVPVMGVFYFMGEAVFPEAGIWGLFCGVLLWGAWGLLAYYLGGSLVLHFSSTRQPDNSRSDELKLQNIVEEITIAAALERRPRIFILDEDAPNAFALGCRPENFSLVVTSGLLKDLDRDELQGVVAHEIGHMVNGDSLFLTFAGILMGMPVMVFPYLLHPSRLRSPSSLPKRILVRAGEGILLLVSLVFVLLAPVITRIFYFSISRDREYLADATAARLTRYPRGLADALAKISAFPGAMHSVNRITAPMCTVNPLQRGRVSVFSWLRTHPETEDRIKALRRIGGEADFPGEPEHEAADSKQKPTSMPWETGELDSSLPLEFTRKGRGWQAVTCGCGAKIQISPFFRGTSLRCRRCGKKAIIR